MTTPPFTPAPPSQTRKKEPSLSMGEKVFLSAFTIFVVGIFAIFIALIISGSWDSPRFNVVRMNIKELNLTSTVVPKVEIDISITNPNKRRRISIHPKSKSDVNGNIDLYHNTNHLGSGFMPEELHLPGHSTAVVRTTFVGVGFNHWKEILLASPDDKGRYAFDVVLYVPITANYYMGWTFLLDKLHCVVVVEKPMTKDSKIVSESCVSDL
ncbi:hypothetical protein QJS04_geneDACA021422 [Acorus gramineus]|uniref:Late embryogenesis abundant protein LEA-2 subgroup domain-containing protein n=1 Tax=Acorus gramineus TaxID=55184 RepID=A0AAV9A6S0_ACOGR|nr:hypothetical protein QJS04_geneDACA021422 [Acorus gramineus]